MPRYRALSEYWRAHPPVSVMVAAYLGIGDDKPKKQDFDGFFSALTGQAPPG